MAIENSRFKTRKESEEEEKRKQLESAGYIALPTYEEQRLIEEKAKEDAAAEASFSVRKNMASDIGRTSAVAARNEIAERAEDLNAQKKAEEQQKIDAQKRKVEEAQREYDAYSWFDKVGVGTSATMADIAKDKVKKQQAEYDRLTMTEQEFEKAHKADFGETIDRFAESAGYGIAKSFGSVVDTTKAIGSGVVAGFQNMDDFKASYNRAYQKSLTDGTSLYDEIDAEYQQRKAKADEVYGKLNVFTDYVDQAAHSFGEQAAMFWAASMATAIAGGAKVFSVIASKADDMIAGGGKVAKAVGNLMKGVNARNVAGATTMFMTSSAQSTKEAVKDMREQNAEALAFGMEPKYTEEEIEQRAATYGLLNGLSESVLEYALGGLTGAQGASKAVKNPLLTALVNYVKGSLGEGAEEITQSLASYGLERAIYDENAELDWREVIDSGIVGAITGFGMGLPSAVQNTRAAVDAKTTIHKIAKDANNANSGIDRAKVIFEAEAVAQSSEELAKKMRETDSEGAEVLADIIAWQGEQARKIADTLEANAAETSTEGAGEQKRVFTDNSTEHIEIERTGRESGAADDDIRMAGELSDILGKKIRFYREEAKDGTIRNGEYHEDTDTIYINAASKNVKSQIVAHELTHSIEKAGAYKSLVDTVFEKLRADGEDIDALYRKKEMLYAKADAKLGSYEEITSEIVAEFVEKRLLTDAESIKSLVQENRTLGQKIKDWFDSVLAKMGNADAQSREYLRKMRDVYAEALGETVSKSGENVIKHDIVVTDDGKMYVQASRNVITGSDKKEQRSQITKFFKELLENKHSVDINTIEGDVLTLTMAQTENKARNDERQANNTRIPLTDEQFAVKLRAESHIDEIAEISTKDKGKLKKDTKNRSFSKDGFSYRTAYFRDFDGTYYEIKLSVGHNGTTATVYNLTQTKSTPPTAKLIAVVGSQPRGMLSQKSISQVDEKVNRENTISDLDGEEITPEREYTNAVERGDTATAQKLVDEAAREAGYTVKAYHGSHERFNEFSHEDAGGLFNFTESRENAKSYALGGGGNRQHVYEQLVAVDQDNGLVWEYDPDEDVYEAIGREDDATGEIMPLPDTASRRVLPRDQVEGNRADDYGNGTYVFRSKNANVGTYYLDVGKTLDLVSNKAEAEAVFREIYDAFEASADSFTDTRRVEIEGALRRILWSERNGFDNFWSETKSEYALRAFEDYIVPELKKRGYNSIYHQDDSHKTYAVFDAEQIKSADPVVYDDNGRIVPLSERFDTKMKDVRYSISEADGDASGIVSEQEQKEALDFIRKKTQRLKAAYDRLVKATDDVDEISDSQRDEIEKAYDAWQESKKTYDMMRDAAQTVNKSREKTMTSEKAMTRLNDRQAKRENRQTVARAQTAFARLGYHIAGAVTENYEDAASIIEDTALASQADYDINRYIEDNNVTPRADNAAKMIAYGKIADIDEAGGAKWSDAERQAASDLAQMYQQHAALSKNTVKARGKDEAARITETYDKMLGGYDWFTDKGKKANRFNNQLQLNLSNPEQVIRDVFGDTPQAKELNDYLIKPTVQNSAEARRQTNRQVAKLREYRLNKSESGLTQLFAEYSTMKESGSKKALLDQSMLRGLLLGKKSAKDIAYRIALKEGEIEKAGKEGENGFTKSITDVIETAQKVVMKRAAERALRDYKQSGGTNASWNMLSKEQKQSKIDAAAEVIADESVGRIEEAAKEMRLLLNDMYDAINAISVIHGNQPIPFRRGYMPHSHRQTAEVQKWFNDHMGGINVTPVGDLPTDIAGKTADRKPNKRWMAHAQERTGPRTTWDAVGNIEEYLRIANDTIYHMDDIKKMRVLEWYIRGIYSVARGETGETAKKKIKNDVLQRMYGAADDETLVFLGLKKNEKPVINDEDMDLSQMTPFVTWLTNYANDLAAKQIFNRDIEAVAGRKYNNLANTITSWSSRVMMQYNISSNLKQLSQVGAVAGDVGMSITKDAAALTARSMRDLGNGTNDLEQKYHISERSTFLAEKQNIEEATFASDHDLTEAQRAKRDKAAEIWDYAWSFTDTTMSRFAVYSYFLEGMQRGMNDADALAYADSKARNILASRMKGSSPLIFQSKNPILRLFTMFQREPLATWEDVLKTMPREYAEYKEANGDKAAKEWIAKRVTGRILGASMTNAVYLALGLGTPAMFDILGAPLSAILEKVIGDLTEDEEDDQTWGEMLKGFGNNLKNEIADDIPFASLIAAITNTAAGTDFESRLPINAPDLDKLFAIFTAPADVAKLTVAIANADDAETIEALREDRADAAKQIPFALLSSILEIIGTAAPAGNQIRKSVSGLIAVLRGGEYTSDGRLKYEVGGLDAVRAVALGKSNTKAAQEWVEEGFGSYSEAETDAYHALVSSGVGKSKAAKYVNAVTDAEKQGDETKAQAEARILDGLRDLDDDQRAELYYELVATDSQIKAIDAAIKAGADRTDAVWAARSIRELSKRGEKVDALIASEMDAEAKRAVYDQMITDEDGDKIDALASVGLDFDDFLAAKSEQSRLNADDSMTASKRATRFMAWIADQGYTDEQEQAVSDTFAFASGFKVEPTQYNKLVDAGVTADNAVMVTDALSGTSRAIDKINAVWSTGLTGAQLDNAVKAVVTEGWYERYRKVIDANVPLDVLTWVLDNADQNGNDSIDNEERTLILSQLALSRKELAALWEATGGSEKSNPYKSSSSASSVVPRVEVPEINVPKAEIPDINVPKFDFDFKFGIGG